MELFILACIGVVAWLLFDSGPRPSPSGSGMPGGDAPFLPGDTLSAANAASLQAYLAATGLPSTVFYADPNDPYAIPPVLGPIRPNGGS